MTIAFGIVEVDGSGCWIGADTLAVRGPTIKRKADKILSRRGLAAAVSGDALLIDVLSQVLDDCADAADAAGQQVSVRSLVAKVREGLAAIDWKHQDREGHGPWWDASFLLTDGRSLVEVQPTMCAIWHGPGEFEAVGCGDEVAYGAAHAATCFGAGPERIATMALQASIAYSFGCGGQPDVRFVPPASLKLVP